MPQYSLSEYTARIAAQIQDGRIEEAIAHARHILSHYPRYLPAYSMLARASMEKGDLSHASHFYQSILSANPEDADAWMNLAQLTDDLGEIEQAAWYMERAFEIAPGNSHIRERLCQLYSQRDGVERTRVKLTPAALARTQARSGSFRRASQKLQRILDTSKNLPPLQTATLEVALATALWNQENKTSLANDVCGSLLQKLPECLQANLIRAQIYSSAGQTQEAAPYLKAAQQLDPEGEFAFRMLGTFSPLPQTRVEIPYLDYQPVQAEPQPIVQEEPKDTSWLDEIGQTAQTPAQSAQIQESDADALARESEPPAPPVPAQKPLPEPQLPGPAPDAEPPVPAWLREIQQESTEDTEPQDDLDWLQEPEEQAAAASPGDTVQLRTEQDEIPDWLEGLRPLQDEPEPQEPEPSITQEHTMVGQVPDWLLDLGQESETPAPILPETEPLETVSEPKPGTERVPDLAELGLSTDPERPAWLQELQADVLGASAAPTPPPTDQVEPAPELPQEPEPIVASQEEPEPYEWLSELGVTDLSPEAEDIETGEPSAPIPAVEAETFLEPTPEDELPDWLLELRDQESDKELAEPTVEPAKTETPFDTKPLARLEQEPTEELVPESSLDADLDQELPEWLQELEPELESEAEPEPAGDLGAELAPDWLSEPQEEPLPTMTVDQMPDWFGELQGPQEAAAGEPSAAVSEPEPTADTEPLEWLQELESAPEQEPSLPPSTPEPTVEQIGPVPASAPPASDLDVEPIRVEMPPEPAAGTPLDLARALLREGALDASAQQYESLLARGDIEPALIAELEEAVETFPEHSGLQRVLGDAYMGSNQLEQALNAYRKALRKL